VESIQVSEGVYWISVPEADLRLLCGCPADTVKHLMQKGLIVKRQENGREYETGPNAILLADTSTQNGGFSNLAEFPVLQMFYRQGMIIPKHPNNTGQRPLIIGSSSQLRAQLAYMNTGKHGLTEPEELQQAGLSAEESTELLDLKTRFAFGRLQPIEEMLQTVTLDHDESELGRGCFIRRKALNIFELRYEDRTIEIDLNLPAGVEYQPAVRLDYHHLERHYFSIIHIGEGDGWDPWRPCMSSLLCYQGKLYLIDAGPHILRSLTALGLSASEIEGVFLTHAHDDHFAGLPALARSDHRIKFYASKLVRHSIMSKAAKLMGLTPQRFESHFEPVDLDCGQWNDLNGLEVLPVPSPHPVETTAFYFRVFWEGGYRTYGHLADIIALDTLKKLLADKKSGTLPHEGLLERTRNYYLLKTDVKKIDAGGGMIHGCVADFAKDQSTRILVAHKEVPLTDAEKEIGSNTVFGAYDVLIPASQNYAMRTAARHLEKYFPEASQSELAVLLNCPVRAYNAGSNVTRRGESCLSVYLVLTGVGELIDTQAGMRNSVSSGSFIGEYGVLADSCAEHTFRAASYLQVLCIPAELYLRFISRNYSMDDTLSFHNRMRTLKNSWLFGDNIASTVLSTIARGMSDLSLSAGAPIVGAQPELVLIRSGHAAVSFGDIEVEQIGPGGIYGEETILLHEAAMGSAVALEPLEAYRIPAESIAEVPIIEWKLLETYERRIAAFATRVSG